MQPTWWNEPIRMYQTNLREVDVGLDVDDVLERIAWLGANTWLLNTAGIVAGYPSRLPFQYPSPWLKDRPSGDLIADALSSSHARGIRLVARCDFSKIQEIFATEHPEWCFRHPNGSPQVYNGLYSVCPSGEYCQERLFDIVGEVLERYDVDGFFFNMFGFNVRDYSGAEHGVCQCTSCQERFADQYHERLPERVDLNDERYLHWLEFTRVTLDDLADRVRAFVKERKPEVGLFLRVGSDVVFREVNNAVDRPQPLWTSWSGEVAREVRAPERRRPILVHCVLFLDIPYRFAPEQPGLVAFELLQALANGAHLSAYLMGTGAETGTSNLPIVREVFQFQHDHEDLYRDLRSAATIALVRSQISEEWYGRAARVDHVRDEFRGLYELLVELHLPFDIIPDEELEQLETAGELGRYGVIVLPNVAALSDALAAVLDRFVHHGGGLVATYETGWYDETGAQRRRMALTSLGVERVLYRRDSIAQARSSYFRVSKPDEIEGLEPGRLVAIDEALLQVQPSMSAEPKLALIPPSRYGPPEKCYWDTTTSQPGMLLKAHGQGKSAYLPWGLGSLYHRLNLPEYRQIFKTAIGAVQAQGAQVVTNAPPQVEVVLGEVQASGQQVVHLINYSGQRGRAFFDPIEVRDIRLGLRTTEGRVARAEVLGEDLAIEASDGLSWVTLPRLNLFEVIVIGS